MSETNPIICIIEDSPEYREVFRRYLSQDTAYRYRFYEEDSGEKGLELCRRVRPDCILLDYTLPDINGLEFLVDLVDESGSVPFTVIMLAGQGNESIALRAMKIGAQDYLVKDEMTPGNLFRAIHNAIERTAMRKTLEKQHEDLERKNQEIQAFAYALAHDLRAPLRAITGFSQIVEQDYRDVLDESGKHYVGSIVQACTQMDRLIEDLLNYTRIEHRTVHNKPVAPGHLLKQIIESMMVRITGLHAQVELAGDFPMVYGDPTLINQIFVNLLDNALTYIRSDVQVHIRVNWEGNDQFVVVRIEDNGIGIAQRNHDKIFNIFQRLHGEDMYSSTGIGLAIVKKAVDLLEGQIWLTSVVGQGCTFFVRLPRYIP